MKFKDMDTDDKILIITLSCFFGSIPLSIICATILALAGVIK